jgi:hypothetical protein
MFYKFGFNANENRLIQRTRNAYSMKWNSDDETVNTKQEKYRYFLNVFTYLKKE